MFQSWLVHLFTWFPRSKLPAERHVKVHIHTLPVYFLLQLMVMRSRDVDTSISTQTESGVETTLRKGLLTRIITSTCWTRTTTSTRMGSSGSGRSMLKTPFRCSLLPRRPPEIPRYQVGIKCTPGYFLPQFGEKPGRINNRNTVGLGFGMFFFFLQCPLVAACWHLPQGGRQMESGGQERGGNP